MAAHTEAENTTLEEKLEKLTNELLQIKMQLNIFRRWLKHFVCNRRNKLKRHKGKNTQKVIKRIFYLQNKINIRAQILEREFQQLYKDFIEHQQADGEE